MSEFDGELLVAAVNQVMPFGKYKGRILLELPEPYLVWFNQQGFPKGKLGEQLAMMYEVKRNGLEDICRPLVTARTVGSKT
ncbi:DUF3820 family protein [Aurantivibrio plasticivorans]